jgi:hypothetical protein
MGTKVWPFLVSRNRELDYRPIVAPQLFVEKGASILLAEAAGGELTQLGHATYREIHGSLVGNVTLIFRVVMAEKRYIDIQESDPLRDQFGRVIRFIEGVVLEGLVPEVIITVKDIQAAQEYVKPFYKEFWEETERSFSAKPSHSFLLHSESPTNKPLVLHKEPPLSKEPVSVRSSFSDHRSSPISKGTHPLEDQSSRNLHGSHREGVSFTPQTVEQRKDLRPAIILASIILLILIAVIIFIYILTQHH